MSEGRGSVCGDTFGFLSVLYDIFVVGPMVFVSKTLQLYNLHLPLCCFLVI